MSYRIDPYDRAIVVEGFNNGIADDPFSGIADERNVNIISIPGEASVNFSTTLASGPSVGNFHVAGVTTGAAGIIALSTGVTTNGGVFVGEFGSGAPTGVTAGQDYLFQIKSGTTGAAIYRTYADLQSDTRVQYTGVVTGAAVTSVPIATPTYGCYDKDFNAYFFIDSAGKVWMIKTGSTTFYGLLNPAGSGGNGNGIVAYRGYLFIFSNNKISYTTTVGNPGPWTVNWQTLNTGSSTNNPHQAMIGTDDKVYYVDANFVGSFGQVNGTTFDPSNSATYSFNATALTLPPNDIGNCLAELGVNLMVGGQKNAIYPWNRTSTNFAYPILLGENWIQRMVTVNTNTYIFAGNRGRIYITNGSQANLFKKIPDHISNTVEPYYSWGDATFNKNQLYFGVTALDNAGSALANASTNGYGAVWAIDLDTGAMRIANELSVANYTTNAGVILAIQPTSNSFTPAGSGLYIGWNDTVAPSTTGVDVTQSAPYTGSQATIDGDLIPIGTYDRPRDNARVEYKLTKPMVAGESITVNWRLDFSQAWTQVFTDNTVGAFSGGGPVNWKNAQWLQVQVVLNSTATTPSYTRLKEIRLTGFNI